VLTKFERNAYSEEFVSLIDKINGRGVKDETIEPAGIGSDKGEIASEVRAESGRNTPGDHSGNSDGERGRPGDQGGSTSIDGCEVSEGNGNDPLRPNQISSGQAEPDAGRGSGVPDAHGGEQRVIDQPEVGAESSNEGVIREVTPGQFVMALEKDQRNRLQSEISTVLESGASPGDQLKSLRHLVKKDTKEQKFAPDKVSVEPYSESPKSQDLKSSFVNHNQHHATFGSRDSRRKSPRSAVRGGKFFGHLGQ